LQSEWTPVKIEPMTINQTAWGIALATEGMCAFIGVASFFSASSDRPGGAVFCVMAALAALALSLSGRQPPALVKTLAAIGIVQVLAAAVMVAAHYGTTSVILAINGIMLAGWVVAAGLFYAAARSAAGNAGPQTRS
jgi:hypothetical protein